MKTKKLFNEKNQYTPQGKNLANRLEKSLSRLYKNLTKLGYSQIEITYMLHSKVNHIDCMQTVFGKK